MKRLQLIIVYLLLTIAVCFAAVESREAVPIEPIDVKPIVKPVFASKAKQWDLTKAYYRKVKMPDGSKVELKSREVLTDVQWQKKADDFCEAMKKAEAAMPENCLDCHAQCGRKK